MYVAYNNAWGNNMRSINKILILIICLFIIGIVSWKYIPMLEWGVIGAHEKNMYDNEQRIKEQGDSYSYLLRKLNNNNDEVELKFSEFTGTDTLYTMECDFDTSIKLNYNLELSKGRFKIVVIDPSGDIMNITESSGKDTKEIKLKSGVYRIKLVGEKTSGLLKISILYDKNINIKVKD